MHNQLKQTRAIKKTALASKQQLALSLHFGTLQLPPTFRRLCKMVTVAVVGMKDSKNTQNSACSLSMAHEDQIQASQSGQVFNYYCKKKNTKLTDVPQFQNYDHWPQHSRQGQDLSDLHFDHPILSTRLHQLHHLPKQRMQGQTPFPKL